MRVAVSGTHGVGKSTLIAAFLRQHPEYAHEPEAFEVLADDIDLTESGAPTPEGLRLLLEYTVSAVEAHAILPNVMFERSPLDYLAYAAASGGAWQPSEKRQFLTTHTAAVRTSMRSLDCIVYLPLSRTGPSPRRGEDKRFRRHVDVWLKRVLLDDVYGLFEHGRPPQVVALPSTRDEQLVELTRLVVTAGSRGGVVEQGDEADHA